MYSSPERLWVFWRDAAQRAVMARPENQRKLAIDRELARRGLFARMRAASAVAQTRAFAEAVNARRAEREAAKNEDDLARLLEALLRELGADMTDLHVRLRRATRKETKHLPRQAAQLRFRICPTRDVAEEAIAEVDCPQPAEPGAAAGGEAQAGQATPSA